MPERQSRHPDNDLIDEAENPETPSQGGAAGGNVSRSVGKRAELHHVRDQDPEVERVRKQDEGDRQPPRPKTNRR